MKPRPRLSNESQRLKLERSFFFQWLNNDGGIHELKDITKKGNSAAINKVERNVPTD